MGSASLIFQELNDFVADAELMLNTGIAYEQVIDLYNYWQSSNTPEGETYEAARLTVTLDSDSLITTSRFNYNIEPVDSSLLSNTQLQTGSGVLSPSLTSIEVNGHSLGGHLAMAFTRLFPALNANAVAVNGLGFKVDNSNVNNLFSALGGGSSFDSSLIQNIYGIDGPEFAAMDGLLMQQPGGWDGIFIEDGGRETWGGHSSPQMTDSMAVYNLLATIAPSLTLDQVTPLLKAASHEAEKSLETIVDAIGDFLVEGSKVKTDDRNDLYQRISAIRDELFVDPDAATPILEAKYQNLQIIDLSAIDAAGIETGGLANIAYRYALVHLNPFVITGNDSLYTDHNQNQNQNQELNIYNPSDTAGQEGHLTSRYIKDRAEFLALKNEYSTQDETGAGLHFYSDRASGDFFKSESGAASGFIAFGTSGVDTLSGGSRDDHLYGGEGIDRLIGNDGADYMEGGKGKDIYYASNGDTILDIDNKGQVFFDETILYGGKRTVGETIYKSADEVYEYTFSGDDLIVTSGGGSITIKNFKPGRVGTYCVPTLYLNGGQKQNAHPTWLFSN